MKKKPETLLDRGVAAARLSVLASVRTRYFPELWYIVENWLFQVKRKRILAIGHGFGLIAEGLAKSGWEVTIVDPSLDALSELKERFSRAGLTASFEQAEPDALPFANGAFAAVASLNTLELAQNPYQAGHEIARVLAPSGKAVIATFNKLGPWALAASSGVLRPSDDRRAIKCLTKGELKRILKATELRVDDIKDRAQYLPLGPKGPKLPLAGAFIALVEKSSVVKTHPRAEASNRPRSRPSLSRKAGANKP